MTLSEEPILIDLLSRGGVLVRERNGLATRQDHQQIQWQMSADHGRAYIIYADDNNDRLVDNKTGSSGTGAGPNA